MDCFVTQNVNAPRNDANAFTLAEVLITIVIVGVIAAITVPNMIMRHQKLETAARVKKVYSELSQVIRMSEANNGPMKNWDLVGTSSLENTRIFMQKYLIPYFRDIQEISEGLSYDDTGITVSTRGINYLYNHSVAISFLVTKSNNMPLIVFTVSPNIKKNRAKYSTMGKNWFYFWAIDGKIIPYGYMENITREDIINGYDFTDINISCNNGRNSYSKYACTFLLMRDGWEFKDDYPW